MHRLYAHTTHFIWGTWASLDFGICGDFGNSPPWILKDDCYSCLLSSLQILKFQHICRHRVSVSKANLSCLLFFTYSFIHSFIFIHLSITLPRALSLSSKRLGSLRSRGYIWAFGSEDSLGVYAMQGIMWWAQHILPR